LGKSKALKNKASRTADRAAQRATSDCPPKPADWLGITPGSLGLGELLLRFSSMQVASDASRRRLAAQGKARGAVSTKLAQLRKLVDEETAGREANRPQFLKLLAEVAELGLLAGKPALEEMEAMAKNILASARGPSAAKGCNAAVVEARICGAGTANSVAPASVGAYALRTASAASAGVPEGCCEWDTVARSHTRSGHAEL
jgi:hypothetical protein